jgi:hypothetical protein
VAALEAAYSQVEATARRLAAAVVGTAPHVYEDGAVIGERGGGGDDDMGLAAAAGASQPDCVTIRQVTEAVLAATTSAEGIIGQLPPQVADLLHWEVHNQVCVCVG